MNTNTKQTENLAECGNKSKPLLANRLFKFRVWDSVDKEMTPFDKIRILPNETMMYELFTEERYNWMQFTGLKDKTRKDVYEGDITENGFIIKWNSLHNCWGYFTINGFKKEILSEIYTPKGRLTHCHIPEKIVGNVFQNFSLLQTTS